MIPFPMILLRLVVALLLGALIGIERESKEQDAGLRTNSLIALGTALFTIISATAFQDLLGRQNVQMDPSRIASYVLAGIGFLGGGSIFLSRSTQKVKGLTTAAAVWTVAAIGMACGAGMLLEAISTTALVMVVLIGMRYLERLLWPYHTTHPLAVHIETKPQASGELLGLIYDIFTDESVNVIAIKVLQQEDEGEHEGESFTLECTSHSKQDIHQAMKEIRNLSGVQSVQLEIRRSRISS
jgi:putative Mg2+ transporter-C (MgtC) family protein